jgi:hypothetical protein
MSTSSEPVRDGAVPRPTPRTTPSRPGVEQAVTGVVPPQLAEATIRTAWPSVTAASVPGAKLGRFLIKTRILAPLGWLLLAPLYFLKILPFLARRYTLTNRRLMIQRGLKPRPRQQVALVDIDEVRLVEGSYNPFYRAGTLEVLGGGQVKLTLAGVPDPESFRQSVLNALMAWVPAKARALPMIPASAQ